MRRVLIPGLLSLAMLALPVAAEARDQIRVVGSSTVYPFVTAAAETFGQGGQFRTPIVESTGTGGGFKLFCAGAGDAHPDMNNASRKITQSEVELCKTNGVKDVTELAIGFDGIVLANSPKAPSFNLTKQQIFLALAREVPKDGALVKNSYTAWNEIDPKLPAQSIEVYGPPPTSGTRDAFVELVMEEGCKALPEFAKAYPDEKARKNACHMLREDGRYIEAGEDDNLIIQKLQANTNALGIVGYGFLDQNRGKVQASLIGGVAPDMANIESGKYGVSRSLYVYVKNAHVGQVTGLAEFAREIAGNAAIGSNGYLVQRGLLPLPEAQLKATQQQAKTLSPQAAAVAPAR